MTKRNNRKTTDSPSSISIGTREKELLTYLKNNPDKRFNKRAVSRKLAIPRTTIIDILNRLEKKGLVKQKTANAEITRLGLGTLEKVSDEGVGRFVKGVGKTKPLSSHLHRFKLRLSNNKLPDIETIKKLNPEIIKENKLKNLHQIIAKFPDHTIIFNPQQAIIQISETFSKEVDIGDLESIDRVLEVIKGLNSIGLTTEILMIEEGHFAKQESLLAQFLYDKVDERYFIELEGLGKLWIDFSGGKAEDETDSKVIRKNMDEFLNKVISGDYKLNLERIEKSLELITRLEASRLQKEIEEQRTLRKKIELRKVPELDRSYFG